MVTWLGVLLWLVLCLRRVGGNAAQTHAGLIIHEVPEYYEEDGITLKNTSGKQSLRFFTSRPESGPAGDAMGFVVHFFREILRDINRRTGILPDYVVELHLSDSMCQPRIAAQTVIDTLYRNPLGFFHLIFGPVCSDTTAVVNDVIQPFKAFQITPLSRSSSLSDRTRYPFLCRTSPSLRYVSIGIARMCKLFGWSRIGSVSDASSVTQSTISAFEAQVQVEVDSGYAFDVDWMSTAAHQLQTYNSTIEAVQALRRVGVKVLVMALYEDFGVHFFCDMYRAGYYGALMQVILATAWWGDTWIREQHAVHKDMRCRVEELFKATVGMLSLGQATFFPSTMPHGVTRYPLSEIKARYQALCREEQAEGCRDDYASYDYDALALAVHVFHVWLQEQGHQLSEIDYRSEAPRQQLFAIAANSSFMGTSGIVSFFKDPEVACERIGVFTVRQYRPSDSGDDGWAEVVSYTHDEGFGTFVPWVPIQWASGLTSYLGNGSGWGQSAAAPGWVQTFGNALGLENVPLDKLVCPLGHRPNFNRSACEPCPVGTSAGSVGSWTCEPCGRGTFAGTTGSDSCSFCPPGQHQARHGASQCDDCEAGTVSDPLALWQCLSCSPGSFTSVKGQSECSRCDIGSYSNRTGMTECIQCEGERMTTTYMAATSPKSCHCIAYTYREAETRECRDCPEGMACPEGSDRLNFPKFANISERTSEQEFPVLLRGHMSFRDSPLEVYTCSRELHCPHAIPGQACASGREGIACGTCVQGYAEAGEGTCDTCDAWSTALPAIIFGCAAIAVVTASTLNMSTNWHLRSTSVILLLTVVGILVSNLQTMTVFRRSALKWEFPLSTVLQVIGVISFELDGLKLQCIVGVGPVRQYILRQCLIPMCTPLILGTVLVKKRWLGGSAEEMALQFVNTLGTICHVFFISILVSSVSALYCYAHPGDRGYSMVSNPSVLCYDSSSHTTMLVVSAFAVLCVPVPYAVIVTQTTYRYPAIVTSNSPRNLLMVRAMRFLFFRFHRNRYYYGVTLLGRNVCVCLVPVIFRDHAGFQVAFMCAILSSFTLIQQQLGPWLSPLANIVDGIMTQLMMLMLVSGVMATPGLKDYAGLLGLTSFICLSLLAMSTLVYAACKLARDRRNYYHMFICHHKAAAAAQARYLKILLEQSSGRSIFIDSDDLKDLQQLFDIVRSKVKTLVVYLTRDTLSRPWCAGEIAIAMAHRVETTGVVAPGYARPPEEELSDPAAFIEDFANCSFDELGVTLDMLSKGFRMFLNLEGFIEIQAKERGRGRLKSAVAQLIGKQASVGGGPIPATPGMVVISADPGDDEGIAAAGILASEIKLEVVRRTWVQICFLADHAEDLEALSVAVSTATALVVMLSRTSLASLPQLVAIVEVMSDCEWPAALTPMSKLTASPSRAKMSLQGPCVIPVYIPGFDFPQKDYYDNELPRVWPGKAAQAREAMKLFFEKIAVCLPVHASDKVISSHTQEILERIQYRRKVFSDAGEKERLSKRWSWQEPPDGNEQPLELPPDRNPNIERSEGANVGTAPNMNAVWLPTPPPMSRVPSDRSGDEPTTAAPAPKEVIWL